MRLFVIGSGSSGNCYLLENETECLIVEAGIKFKKVKQFISYDVGKIAGVVASHVHHDHAGRLKDYENTGIPIFRPYEKFKKTVANGNFKIYPFELFHNVRCFGFYITHPDMGILVYASDTEYIKYTFKGVNHFLVEANYSTELVERDSAKYEHQITGHMNIDTTCRFLKKNNHGNLKTVTLCHLSADCGNAEDFKARAEEVVDCPVYVAKKGLEINLDLIPDWAK